MIIKPRIGDIKIIGYYLGKMVLGLGLTLAIPVALALCLREINACLDFLVAMEIAFITGVILTRVCRTDKDLNWMQGMVVVSLSWLAAMFLGAIPLYASGHWGSYLDACFDSMSGISTTGLILVMDLDHLSYSHNLWRHLLAFIGGQGIIIIGLSFLFKGSAGAFKMYVGEGRDEKILPNVIHTSRFIWLVSIVYLLLSTLVLGIIGILSGMRPFNAFFHGACIFMAAFDTAGFAPSSQSVLYYHSLPFEIATIVIMILGAINFRLHYHIWMRNRREIWKNLETRTFAVMTGIAAVVAVSGLAQTAAYPGALVLFRKGFYQIISAQTTTGFMTIYAPQFAQEWSDLALAGVIFAMAFGGCVCSTSGAIKMLRVGVIFNTLLEDIKRIILPEAAIVVKKFHHIKDLFIEDKFARAALLTTLAYLGLYAAGTFVGMLYGNSFLHSLFESTSAAGNVGLSCGITSAGMPTGLKITYIIQMWAGRLEFMSIFTLIGVLAAVFRGKK